MLIDLDEVVKKAQSLDPLPASLVRLAQLVAQQDPDLNAVVETVALDQALTGELLSYANSAASGSRQPLATVRAAVIRLGMGPVLSFAMACGMRGRMGRAIPALGLGEGELWRHSVASALAAESMTHVLGATVRPECFTAALLHDVGKLALARYIDPGFHLILERTIKEAGYTRLAAESQLLGAHHGELGGWVAENWGLPAGIVEGISHHHLPELGSSGVADVVHAANEVAKLAVAGPGPDDGGEPLFELIQPVREDVRERLGLDEAGMQAIVSLTEERLAATLAQYA